MNQSLDRFFIDVPHTLGGAMFLGIEPKMLRGDKNGASPEQAKDKDGNLKWSCTLAVQVKSFDTIKYVTLPITVSSPSKPYTNIVPGTPVTIEKLEAGVMAQAKGFSIFYSIESPQCIRPLQPARSTSGQ